MNVLFKFKKCNEIRIFHNFCSWKPMVGIETDFVIEGYLCSVTFVCFSGNVLRL